MMPTRPHPSLLDSVNPSVRRALSRQKARPCKHLLLTRSLESLPWHGACQAKPKPKESGWIMVRSIRLSNSGSIHLLASIQNALFFLGFADKRGLGQGEKDDLFAGLGADVVV